MAVWLGDVADDSAELADNWPMSWTNRCLPRGRPELAKMVKCKIMASTGFDPVTSAIKAERLHHSSYMGFLVCVVRIVYLNLKSVADGREKGPGLAPTPCPTTHPHNREQSRGASARGGHMVCTNAATTSHVIRMEGGYNHHSPPPMGTATTWDAPFF